MTLPDASPAWVEVVDVTGRRVARQPLRPAAGTQDVELRPHTGARPGIDFVRVVQGSQSVQTRLVVVE